MLIRACPLWLSTCVGEINLFIALTYDNIGKSYFMGLMNIVTPSMVNIRITIIWISMNSNFYPSMQVMSNIGQLSAPLRFCILYGWKRYWGQKWHRRLTVHERTLWQDRKFDEWLETANMLCGQAVRLPSPLDYIWQSTHMCIHVVNGMGCHCIESCWQQSVIVLQSAISPIVNVKCQHIVVKLAPSMKQWPVVCSSKLELVQARAHYANFLMCHNCHYEIYHS